MFFDQFFDFSFPTRISNELENVEATTEIASASISQIDIDVRASAASSELQNPESDPNLDNRVDGEVLQRLVSGSDAHDCDSKTNSVPKLQDKKGTISSWRKSGSNIPSSGSLHTDLHVPQQESIFDLHQMQLTEFWSVINDESSTISDEDLQSYLPEGQQIPLCDCILLCSLRSCPDGDFFHQMWTCSHMTCMHFEFFRSQDEQGNWTETPTFHTEVDNDFDYFVDNAGDLEDAPPIHVNSQGQVVSVNDEVLTLQQFWETVSKSSQLLDAETAQFISHQLSCPLCDCHAETVLSFCQTSGGIYAVCATQSCFFVC